MIDFDSAARWSSFKLAAQELHKTAAAVSQQIKQLEQELGFALFIRYPRRIALTEKGEELAVTVARTLADLRAKVAGLRDGDEERILRISTTHSFAIKCLVPRMGGFTRLYPELDVRLDVGDHKVNLDDDSTDVAIRYNRKKAEMSKVRRFHAWLRDEMAQLQASGAAGDAGPADP